MLAVMRRRTRLPLTVPVPFRTPTTAVATRAELLEMLTVVDALHDLTKAEQGTVVAGALRDIVDQAEPRADDLVIDLELAIAVGVAVSHFESLVGRAPNDDTVTLATWNVLAWAAMEHAGGAPERHGPWIAYGVLTGYYVARVGRPAVSATRAALEKWMRERIPPIYSARWEGRLVGDFGIDADGRIAAYNYLPLRPSGIEHLHDEVLFDLAWDDLAERVNRGRPRATPRLDNTCRFEWTVV
jgi:hypothetical protein